MNFNTFIVIAKNYFERIRHFLKELIKVQYFWHYVVISIFLIILFSILTFPYEILIQNQIKEIEKNIANYISVRKLKINVITDSIAEDVVVEFKNGSQINLQNVMFSLPINPISLFITRHFDGEIKINSFRFNGEKIQVLTNADIIYDLKYDKNVSYPVDGNIISTLKEVSIKGISIQGFEIPDLKISQIKSELVFQKGQIINLKYLIVSGSEIKGNAYGTITLSNYFQNSSLNITIQIDPQSSILQDYQVLLGSMIKSESKSLTIKIMGTIGNPNFVTQ